MITTYRKVPAIIATLVAIIAPLRAESNMSETIRIPAEWDRHHGTYMVYPASTKIWKGAENLGLVRNDIIRIAKAISKYESVTLLVDPTQISDAESELKNTKNIEIHPMPVDDLWARDTLPVFGYRGDELVGVDFNFNGWGKKQEHKKDNKVARTLLEKLRLAKIDTPLVGEGGALETDGEGTLLVTESSFLNENRNPDYIENRNALEDELKRVLGMEKVIWFDGVYGEDITDAHVDCLARFIRPGVVLLNRPSEGSLSKDVWSNSSDQAKRVLESETDAKGRKLEIVEIHEADTKKIQGANDEFLASYVNFYIANGAIIVPKFGDDDADVRAQKILQFNFPGRDIVPVAISELAAGGGGIHCATHDIPCYSKAVRNKVWNSCGSGASRSGGFPF